MKCWESSMPCIGTSLTSRVRNCSICLTPESLTTGNAEIFRYNQFRSSITSSDARRALIWTSDPCLIMPCTRKTSSTAWLVLHDGKLRKPTSLAVRWSSIIRVKFVCHKSNMYSFHLVKNHILDMVDIPKEKSNIQDDIESNRSQPILILSIGAFKTHCRREICKVLS